MTAVTYNKRKLFYAIILVPLILLITSLSNRSYRKDNPDPDPKLELESFHVADGFEVSLFAAEPLVMKPIQMNWDAEGRLWVVTSTAYPNLKHGEEANDKIFVLEDADGDGKAEKSTIFAEGLQTPTGILPGDGGVYVANSTEILFLKDTDGDGKADTRTRILNGFGTADVHHLIHTFRWGPEGRLYFNQSIYTYSHVETPSGVKNLEGGGVWSFDPKKLDLDIYARGLVNPWGLEFNRWGQTFLTDGAGNEGINYGFPGATFVTAKGAERTLRGLNPGQPKHCGLTLVSGRHLPDAWQGSLLANDFRANRINQFKVEEQGSGFASRQAEDLLWTDDVAFRPVDISIGPDGAIYVADWYNPIIQHGEVDFNDPRRDRQHGRIWRIVAKSRPLVKAPNLLKASVPELLDYLKLPEDWTRSQAKQVLKARGANIVVPELQKWIAGLDKKDPDYEHQLLEALWMYQTLDTVNEQLLLSLINAESYHARAAGFRALQFWYNKLSNVPDLLSKGVKDKHPSVRLEAVIGLRKLRTAESARAALVLLDQPMDEFLDFALWQTIKELEPAWLPRVKAEESFLGDYKKKVFALKSVSNPDAVNQLAMMYRDGHVAEEYQKDALSSIAKWGSPADLNIILDMAVKSNQNKNTADQLAVLELAAKSRGVKPDQNLNRIAGFINNEDESIAVSSIRLIGYWRMEKMNGQLTGLIQKGNKNIKKAVLTALVSIDSSKAEKLLIEMAGAKNPAELRMLSAASLVSLNPSEAARVGAEVLRTIPDKEDASDLFKAFIARKDAIGPLAKELMAKKMPASTAKTGRQLVQLMPLPRHKDEEVKLLKKALEASGGTLPVERMPQQMDAPEINSLAAIIKASADPDQGEIVFRKTTCYSCHAIGGAGGLMGPDLSSLGTSSPVETIMRSVLYPSLSIKEGYELQRIVKKDGSELMGYLVSNGNTEVILRDMTGAAVSVPKSLVDAHEKVPGSLMPPGLTAGLTKEQFSNLIGFLSRLGESGKFRVPTERYVRHWETVYGDKELVKKIQAEGPGFISKENAKISFQPTYSKVAGDLPIEELPVVEINSGKRYSFARFQIEVLNKGNVKLAINSTAGITAWIGSKPINLSDNGVTINLAPGIQEITFSIDRTIRKTGPLSVELQDADSSPAQTRLVVSK